MVKKIPKMSLIAPNLPGIEMLGKQVELSRIEKELQELFVGDGVEEGSGESGGIARASLLNLALYNEDQTQLEDDAAALQKLTSETACRSLLIHADSTAKEINASAWVQAHCQIGGGGKKQVCTEQVSFFLEGDAPGLVRNIVFANLDSDLPLAFWWRGEFSDAFEDRLYSRIDRLIFDSESWESPRNQFLRLRDAEKSNPTPFVAHDLAYTRTNSIRHAITNAFERPGMGGRASDIQSIPIRFSKGNRMSAIYLAAWIASRLGENLDRNKSKADHYHFLGKGKNNRPDAFEVILSPLDEDRKGAIEVDIETSRENICVSRCQTKRFLRTRIIGKDDGREQEDWLPVPGASDPSLVTEILHRAGRNRSYNQLLPLVRELIAL